MNWKNASLVISLLLIMGVIAGCRGQKLWTLPELVQNAKPLEGKTIRVRGQAFLWVDPSQAEMWMFGGCAINRDGTLIRQGNVTGWITLIVAVQKSV